MSEWKVYSTKGVEKAQVKELELHDEWMAECYLTVTVKSANPVSFQIGDYIDYRGERYSINYDPTVLKKARKGTYGEGFIYDSIKFVSDSQSKIVGCDFTDIVLDDNQMHYTGLPTFPFYCESVDDLLDRVQACLEELYPGRFILIGLNTARNAQRGLAVGRESDFVNAYKQYVDPTGAEKTDSYGKTSVALSVDNITCWEAITKINSDFGLNFIMRGDVVIAGINGVFTPDTFRYGKGNGLYEIERISEQDQQVITRLKAYGSEENLPTRYYAELNLQVFAHVERIEANYETSGLHYAAFWLDLDFNAKYFTERSKSYPVTSDRTNYIVRITANGITVKGYVRMAYDSQRCYIYSEYTGVNPEDDRDETDQAAMNAFSEAIKQGDTVYFVGGIEKGAFPLSNRNYATENLPNNMSVSRLMLPGFPNKSLYDWVKEHGGTDCDDKRGIATINGFTGYFSKDKHRPWLQSLKAEDYDIRPGNIYFDGSNDTENIHPTLEGMKYGGHDVDVIAAAEQITDNGVYGEGNVPNFTITLPILGFDLAEVYEEGATIDMKDGMCGSRSFKMANRPIKNSNGQWECKVERVKDDSLDLWFPYKDFQIKAGDHYVLTGIKLPNEYVSAASEKLFDAAIEALQKNDTTRFTYQPRIDEIWMARQHDAAIKDGETSLHDTLHAGDIFLFKDDDLGIDEGIIIDVLTIRERGNDGIPTYEVTLRNEKQVSSIQRMIDKAVGSNASGAGGGGYTSRQIQSLIENYGGERFLSKLNDDTAQGFIRFLKGFIVGSGYSINSNGEAVLKRIVLESLQSSNYVSGLTGWNIDKNGNMEAETLHLRSALEVDELRINRQQAQEGDTIYAENDQIESVEEQYDEAQDITTYILTLKEKWEGYFTAQQYGNILRGKINTLAAKDAGVSDYTGQEYQASQQEDEGGNKYYTSFMQTIATHNTDPNLGVNQIRVVLFGDSEVPMTKNYPPCALMAIARWGCIDYSAEYEGTPKYNDVVRSIKRRQQSFMVLSSEGRIVKLNGVDSPILRNGNFGTSLGILPEFVQNYPVVHDRMIAGRDYLYAQGVVVGDFIKIDVEGNPLPTVVDKGEWQNNTPYYYNKFNETTQQYETHRVRHNGGTWQCLQSQPVISGGVATYYEPKWNSPYWMLVDGNDNLTIEFVSTNGSAFYQGYVNTVITPHLFYGNVEIDADGTEIAAQYWNWTRETESGKTAADELWDDAHVGVKVLTLTNNDMPTAWGRGNKAIFTCTVVINDGKSNVIVQNQVIA